MKVKKIYDVMDMAIRARKNGDVFNPCFVSAPGLGKTEITQAWAKSRGLKSIVVSLSTIDPPDFKGYPIVQTVNGRQRLSFATPDTWPDEGEGVIILEELNRAPTSVMQCVLSLTDSRRGFDGYRLPDGWIVIGCINPENSEYDVNTMDPALKDRFEIFNVTYDKENFVSFMKETEWNKDVLMFVESGIFSYVEPEGIKNTPGAKYVSPRTLSKLNAVIKAGFDKEDEIMMYTTILGNNIGRDFYAFRHNESPVLYYDLMNNTANSLAKLSKFSDSKNFKGGMISLTIKDIVEVNEITDEMLVEVVKNIPVDQGTVLIRELEFKRKDKTVLQRICKNFPEVRSQFKSVLQYGK
jgi:hypothetical protein